MTCFLFSWFAHPSVCIFTVLNIPLLFTLISCLKGMTGSDANAVQGGTPSKHHPVYELTVPHGAALIN